MSTRSAKRQRLTVPSSDDTEDLAKSPPTTRNLRRRAAPVASEDDTTLRLPSRTQTPTKRRVSTISSTEASPQKGSPRVKKGQKAPNNQSIFSFFNSTTREQSLLDAAAVKLIDHGQRKREGFANPEALDDEILDVDDDVSETLGATSNTGHHLTGVSQNRLHPADGVSNGDQKIRKTPDVYRASIKDISSTPQSTPEQNRPWVDRYAPVSLGELAVHNRKVADVQAWLKDALEGRTKKRLLVLKGAAGAGKTSTVKLLSKELDFGVLEWHNPLGSDHSTEGFVSMSAQFEDFLGRGNKFGSLEMLSADGKSEPELPSDSSPNSSGRVIVIEEFPSSFSRSTTAMQSFRSAVLRYIAVGGSGRSPFDGTQGLAERVTPLVMIISESVLSTSSASADSFTAHRLLGPEILTHACTSVIEFNPIARTILTKALELVLQKDSRTSGRRKAPGSLVLERLAEVGDIRSAVGSLEFMCIRGDQDVDWGGMVHHAKSKKRGRDAPTMTATEKESLEMVTQREASLGLFHAVAKVVYNKREGTNPVDDGHETIVPPPDHLSHHARPQRSQVHVEDLIDETGADTSTFISALHENYLLSCNGTSIDDCLGCVEGCIEALSESDLLCPDWSRGLSRGGLGGGVGRGAFQGAGADTLRQDEIPFQISVRGILFALPSPVKRLKFPSTPATSTSAPSWDGNKRSGSSGRGDAFKMYYPASLRLWRRSEEIEGLVDLWAMRLLNGDLSASISAASQSKGGSSSSASLTSPRKSGSIESWKDRNSNTGEPVKSAPAGTITKTDTRSESDHPLYISLGSISRIEMLLDRLPYMASLQRRQQQRQIGGNVRHGVLAAATSRQRELEKMTSFTGFDQSTVGLEEGAADDDDADVDGGPVGTSPARRPRPRPPKSASSERDGSAFAPSSVDEKGVENLVLSDDDIEDDDS